MKRHSRVVRKLQSKPPPTRIVVLVGLGILSLLLYLSWWFHDDRLNSPWLSFGFLVLVFYSGAQIIGNWLLYIAAHYSDKSRL